MNFSPLESMDRQLHVYGRSVYIIEAIASKLSGGAAYFRWEKDNRPALFWITGSACSKTFLFCTKKFSLLSIAQKKDVA